jgi:hypothetical protein
MEKLIVKIQNKDDWRKIDEVEIKVGHGVTIVYYSDRYPGTIIEIDPKLRWIKVQEDHFERIDNNGMSESQFYTFSRNPNGNIHIFKRTRKDKLVYTSNGLYYDWGTKLSFAGRRAYYDYSY